MPNPQDAGVQALLDAADAAASSDEAAEILQRGLTGSPDDLVLVQRLAATFRKTRQFGDALTWARRAAVLAPEDPEILLYLGDSLRLDSRLPDALEVHRRVLDRTPSPAARAAVANDLVLLGRPDEALPLTDEIPPGAAGRDLQLMRIRALNGLGRHRDAVALVTPLLDTHPRLYPAWIALAEAQRGLGLPWLEAAQGAIDILPDIEISTYWAARIAIQGGREAEAIELLEDAVATNPRYYHALAQLGISYANVERIDDAEHAFATALQIAPWDDLCVGAHALFQATIGRGVPDLAALEQRARDRPFGGLAGFLARIYRGPMQDNARSVAMFELAAEHAPDAVEGHRIHAAALLQAGRTEEALAAYQRAVALHPGYGVAWLGLGMALRELGRSAEAVAPLTRAVELMPVHGAAFHGLGLALI